MSKSRTRLDSSLIKLILFFFSAIIFLSVFTIFDLVSAHYEIQVVIFVFIIAIIVSFIFGIQMSKKISVIINELKESKHLFDSIANYSNDSILVMDQTLIINYNSKSTLDLFRFKGENATGLCLCELIDLKQLFPDLDGCCPTNKSEYIEIDTTLRTTGFRKDGTTFECEVVINKSVRNNEEGFIAIIRDLTERHKLDAQLKLFSKIVQQAADIIFLTDTNLEIIFVNDAFKKTTGYTEAEAIGMNPRILKSGKMSKEYYRMVYETVTAGAPFHQEVINKRKDGRLFIYDQTITPIKDSSGRITYFLSVGRDVTEQHNTNRLLEQKSEQLKLFIKHTPAALAMYDKNLNFLLASNRFYTDFKVRQPSIIGMNHFELFSKTENLSVWKSRFSRCLQGEALSGENEIFIHTNNDKDNIRWQMHAWYTNENTIGGLILYVEIITDKIRYQKELEEKELRFRSFINQSQYSFFITDEDSNIIDFNDFAAEKLGYTKEEFLGMNVSKIDASFNKGPRKNVFKFEKKSGEYINFETPHIRKDGTIFLNDVSLTQTVVGNKVYYMAISRDITEQKKAEHSIRENEEKFKSLAESITDIFLAFDNQLHITYWNTQTELFTGKKAEDVIGKKISEIIDADDAFKIETVVKNSLDTNHSIRFTQSMKKDGKEYIFELVTSPSYDRVTLIARDITQELAYKESLYKNAQLLDMVSESVMTATINGVVTTWNKGSVRMFGYTESEMLGKNLEILYAYEDGLEVLQETIIKPLLEIGHAEREVELRSKSGDVVYCYIAVSTMKDSNGNVTGMVGSAIDIGRRKDAENKLKNLNEELEERILKRTYQLENLYSQLQASDQLMKLIKEIASSANTATDLNEILLIAVRKICEHLTWPIGHVYFLNSETNTLIPGTLWYIDQPDEYLSFVEETLNTTFKKGVGLPGAVYMSRQPVWYSNIENSENFIRKNSCMENNIQCSFAFPAIVNNEVVAVLEFFTNFETEPDNALLIAVDEIGKQLGYVIQRHRIEDTLKLSEERLQLAFEGGGFAWWDWDFINGTIHSHPLKYTMIGYTSEEVKSDSAWWNDKIIPEDLPKSKNALNKMLKGETEIYNLVLRVKHKNGKTVWIHDKGQIVERVGSQVKRIVGTTQDITQLKEAEEQIEKARAAAESSNKAKSIFLANMSHEIRTPLNAIIGFSQLLDQDGSLTAEQRKRINTINRSGEHLLSLINDILEISKIEAGRVQVQFDIFNIILLLKEIKAMFTVRCQQKGISIDLNITPDVPNLIKSDEKKLRQIMLNLISNAVKFTDKGSVTINTALLKKDNTDYLKVEVIDTGCGIEDDSLQRVFDYFEQTDIGAQSTEGTGLGLAISREFTTLLNGSITVTSKVNQGSNFTFYVPIEIVGEKQKIQHTGIKVNGIKSDKSISVLCADDNENNRELLIMILEQSGFQCDQAKNGEEVLSKLETGEYDLLLLDLSMPVIDGFTVLERIRKNEKQMNLPVIVITAHVLDSNKKLLVEQANAQILIKPIHMEKLLNTIGKVLNIEYSYQSSPEINTTMTKEMIKTVINELPDELRNSLQESLINGDRNQIDQNLSKIDLISKDLHTELLDRINRYEYEFILNLL
jgi:PAS domain S-box-containing protein